MDKFLEYCDVPKLIKEVENPNNLVTLQKYSHKAWTVLWENPINHSWNCSVLLQNRKTSFPSENRKRKHFLTHFMNLA